MTDDNNGLTPMTLRKLEREAGSEDQDQASTTEKSLVPRVTTQDAQGTQPDENPGSLVLEQAAQGTRGPEPETPERPEWPLTAQNISVKAGLDKLCDKRVDLDHEPIDGPGMPIRFARWFLGLTMVCGEYTLRHWRGSWIQWTGTKWEDVSTADIEHHVYRLTEDARYEHTSGDSVEVKAWNPTPAKVGNVIGTMKSVAMIPDHAEPGSWMGRFSLPGIHIAFTNGVLDLDINELKEHSPKFFNLYSINSTYDPHSEIECSVFFQFLDDIGFSEREKSNSRDFIQEWFGYVLSGLTDQHKMALLLGKPRSGKGTLARLLIEIMGGSRAVAAPTLKSLTDRFGRRNLIGKPLAIIGDAREVPHDAAEILLGISGEDTQEIDIKYRDPWTGKLPTRIMILSNQMPMFKDASGVIASRFIILEFKESFLNREDKTLGQKLSLEIPGILKWALEGLTRLEKNGRFTEPEGSDNKVLEMEEMSSDVKKFVRECCKTGFGLKAKPIEIFHAWKAWCEIQNRKPGTVSMLSRDLSATVDAFNVTRPRGEDGRQTIVWLGIGLQ